LSDFKNVKISILVFELVHHLITLFDFKKEHQKLGEMLDLNGSIVFLPVQINSRDLGEYFKQ
jgi:hypothetical protein